LNFTTAGQLVLWLGVCLLATGVLLTDAPVILSGALLLLYLLVEGVSFHHEVNTAKESIRLRNTPPTINTTIGSPFRVQTVFANASNCMFSIIQFHHDLPAQIQEDNHTSATFTLQPRGTQHIETLLRTGIPGTFEITTSTGLVERHTHMFSQPVAFPNKLIITAQPFARRSVNPIDAEALEDLVVDHTRRGSGTDLAGIRPHNLHDDFHRIDWKATARKGRLMSKESYLEKEPTLILMVDVSTSQSTGRLGHSTFLNEAANLLAAIRTSTPMGLILFDNRDVVANIEARQGIDNRERVLHKLLDTSHSTLAQQQAAHIQRTSHTYADLTRISRSLQKRSGVVASTKFYQKRLSSFASIILPFYERAGSKYLERVGRTGAFKAFQIVCTLPAKALVIAILNDETNFDGLAEGAKNARILNHQVVLTIVGARETKGSSERLSELQPYGVGVLRCSPEELAPRFEWDVVQWTL
jgi:uncharacterized protein (DUF58 family)